MSKNTRTATKSAKPNAIAAPVTADLDGPDIG